ncbi:hypothetical protein N7592_23255 [Pseudomonas juntendi]|uniref:hypothetical protein n=1 Tax=Pseudomonas juntendi TaxID=2666183 RepID=UPI0024498938|nr:hypothetical protein [Pseudomonas juntendi]MDG9876066.1 hypothetical protein [Pseudomonas juntendi]
MMSEQEALITTVITRLWRNQIAMCEALPALALLLAESVRSEHAARVMQLSARLLDSDHLVEPAITALVAISGKRFQPANDDGATTSPTKK